MFSLSLRKATELLYGGAGGGGKSHFLRVFANAICSDIAKLQVYLFRRTYKELQDDHVNGPTGFLEMLAPWIANGRVVWNKADYDLTFWNGSQIHLRHCQREDDRFKYRVSREVLAGSHAWLEQGVVEMAEAEAEADRELAAPQAETSSVS